jgi:hypothetical protein
LSKILFGGFSGGHKGHKCHCNCHSDHHNEKWMHLTPEEKEKMKRAMRTDSHTSE